MKKYKFTFLAFTLVIVAACHTAKKATAPATSSAPSSVPSSSVPLIFAKPSNGVYAPGNEELVAIQARYKDVTLEKLKLGHIVYAQGACTNCHGPQSIYEHSEADWKNILDDMALRANISDAEKDAVSKYILAIRATQPK